MQPMQCMNFLKPLLDSLFPPPPQTAAPKLKGYFELAKEEIDKAIRAEQRGLPDDALAHYNNAQKVMAESHAVVVSGALSSREEEEIGDCRKKMSKWQGEVAERVRVLGHRTDAAATKITPSYVSSTLSSAQKTVQHVGSFRKNQQTTGYRRREIGEQKPTLGATSNYDTRLVEMVKTTIVDKSPAVKWKDIAGLDKAKQALMEMVILPSKRQDLFTGLRKPARGLLLFGPPGNGKTMLAKAVASESQATFFNVSASSLTSKWVGEAEKLVRTLFTVAVERQPSIIFIDEIDSILSTRVAKEDDASRRLKSEFLVQFDGVTSNQHDLVIVVGATNKPQELDDAVLRRLVKRIYIPLPDEKVRRLLLKNQLKGKAYSLPDSDLERLAKVTNGYSGSDLQALCEEAAMMPIRELGPEHILRLNANQVRPLRYSDVQNAMTVIRPSLQRNKWKELEDWNKEFGSN